jgi:hypothetical protein
MAPVGAKQVDPDQAVVEALAEKLGVLSLDYPEQRLS